MAPGQHLMHTMAQLMRERHDVARAAEEVQEDIGMGTRHGRMRKGAGRLARPDGCVDPAFGEEPLDDLRHVRREAAIGFQHDAARLVPADDAVVVARQRRIAVPMVELLQAQPLRLQPVIAVRKRGISRLDRADHGRDHVVLEIVLEVAGRDRLGMAAPAVVDLLVLGQRVVDQRESADRAVQPIPDRNGRRRALGRIGVAQEVEGLGHGQNPIVDREAHRRQRLVEEARPGGAAADIFLVEQLFQLVRQLVRSKGAQIAQPGLPARQHRRGQFRRQHLIRNPVDLEREEQCQRADAVQPFLHGLIEAADFRVVHVAGMEQPGIGADARQHFLHPLILDDGRAQFGGAKPGDARLVPRPERLGRGLDALQIGFELC